MWEEVMKPCKVSDLVTAILRSINRRQKSTLGVYLKWTFSGFIHTGTCVQPLTLIRKVLAGVLNLHS